jgi:hypothetical protein
MKVRFFPRQPRGLVQVPRQPCDQPVAICRRAEYRRPRIDEDVELATPQPQPTSEQQMTVKVKLVEIHCQGDGYYGETYYHPERTTAWDTITEEEFEALKFWVEEKNKSKCQYNSGTIYALVTESQVNLEWTIKEAIEIAKKAKEELAIKQEKNKQQVQEKGRHRREEQREQRERHSQRTSKQIS